MFLAILKRVLITALLLILGLATPALADQTEISTYRRARDLFWEVLYPSGAISLYCGQAVPANPDSDDFNIEHIYPRSWMKEAAGCLGESVRDCRQSNQRFRFMESDLHNLYPAETPKNSERSSKVFSILPGNSEDPDCDFESTNDAVEPLPASRGNIARAIFYMNQEYGADIAPPNGPSIEPLLQAWHCSDPVDSEERRRNDVIEQLQGTRNPFIDDPTLIECGAVSVFPND
ncbi:Endonuclease I (plasmid) [Gloeothece citriformis PCC 7424]|uniref:Endonuclease I n=1 Tax=Gloeothece citriformis (strain PCC 7424) TaxID=65393 RepID=B7KMS7_GLOC7|nr:endonuclease [Gloeothece citriformis]ACK74099.1 Endonuclease I [Gloeothece citriformis PCC 7424]